VRGGLGFIAAVNGDGLVFHELLACRAIVRHMGWRQRMPARVTNP
jgi:hypothetical protein